MHPQTRAAHSTRAREKIAPTKMSVCGWQFSENAAAHYFDDDRTYQRVKLFDMDACAHDAIHYYSRTKEKKGLFDESPGPHCAL